MRINRRYLSILAIALAVVWGVMRLLNDYRDPGGCAFTDRSQVNSLEFVSHARCRMRCRDVSQELVERVYLKGAVNCEKSGEKNGDMRYALEMEDRKGDNIRVIVEDENDKHIIITVIRLGAEDQCECS